MKLYNSSVLYTFLFMLMVLGSTGQERTCRPGGWQNQHYSRLQDSVRAVRIPLLPFPEKYRNRALPALVDNSKNKYWPGIIDQYTFACCQQVCGVGYVFSYEINRLRDRIGWYWENCYPAHYTWNFMNQGNRNNGVDFLESFEAIRQQGQMTFADYGIDTATGYTGWITGYDKYYRGMYNHIRQVKAIMTNSIGGINELRNYLYDHLDGSSTGGITCFTTDAASLYGMPVIPPGLPGAGLNIITQWHNTPEHGMTVVGYNDSIRYDVNGDGKFTNDLDINGDGIVDARDWEIGAFKVVNSFGNWWSDTGYVYSLYRAFALNFQDGGVWNNRVYVMDADTAYRPLLTLKVNLSYNLRDRIRVMAGVSSDTNSQMPDHVIDFPIFNFQGGEHAMQGREGVAGAESIEFGLDVTELLNFIPSATPARYFLALEERDEDHQGTGTIGKASFISYQNGVHEFPCAEEDVNIRDNAITLASAVFTAGKPVVEITTGNLPPYNPGQPYQYQMNASGGRPPYKWSLVESFAGQPSAQSMPNITGTSLVNTERSFARVALPFSFPFHGKNYDSIYVNYFGFITFEPQYLPGLFTTSEVAMLKMIACIAPAFSLKYYYNSAHNDGIFVQEDPSKVVLRWKASVAGQVTAATNDFALLLFPDGHFEFRFGTMENQGFVQSCYTGSSNGDDLNYDIQTHWDANELSGKSFRYTPGPLPAGIALSEQGLLTVAQADSTRLYDLEIRVADAGKMTDSKLFGFSTGLRIESHVAGTSDDHLEYGKQGQLNMTLANTGTQLLQNLVLKLQSADSLLNVTDSILTIDLLQPSQTVVIPAAFSFSLKNPVSNAFPVMLQLKAQSGQRNWQKREEFQVAAPTLTFHTPDIQDGDNNLLDPGEVADLVVSLQNTGALAAHNLQFKLVSHDTAVTILSGPSVPIAVAGPRSANEFRYQIKAIRHILPGSQAGMTLSLEDSAGVIQTMDFNLMLGKKQVAVINLATSRSSLLAMAAALDSLHAGYDTITAAANLPSDYSKYSSVFLILGTTSSGWHTLTQSETVPLVNYLQKQGSLYMESYLTWYYTNNTALHPYFNYITSKIPDYTYQQMNGVKGTFCDSVSFLYTDPLNHATFSFEPKSPAYATMVNGDTPPKDFEIVYNGNDYKTIGTFLGFGAMAGSAYPSTRLNLMHHYLTFFGLNLTGPYPLFHAASTSVCQNGTLDFTDDSFDHITSWHWEFSGGSPSVSSLQNPRVKYDTPGQFDVKLTVTSGSATKSILKKSYIRVDRCSASDELSRKPGFRIFPNPASGKVTVDLSGEISGKFNLLLTDLAGRRIMEQRLYCPAGGGTLTLDISGYKKGMYLLRLHSGTKILTTKLIIY